MATYSEVDICNIALHAVGAEAITSLDADKKGARACNSFYAISRDYLLSAFDWSFARKFKNLTVIDTPTEEVPEGYFVYQLPTDCEIVRKLWPYQQRDRWEIMGDKLWSVREDEVGLYYTTTSTNTHLFSTAFSHLLAIAISVRLAPIVAQDETLAGKLFEQFLVQQAEAYAIDANASNNYRSYDETPENDTFVNPDLAGFFGVSVKQTSI